MVKISHEEQTRSEIILEMDINKDDAEAIHNLYVNKFGYEVVEEYLCGSELTVKLTRVNNIKIC